MLLSKAIYSTFRLYIFCQYVCSLGFEPTTFCAANAMLYHWATGTLKRNGENMLVKRPNTSPYTPSQCSSISLRSAEVPAGKRYEMTSTMWADRRDLTHRGHSLILIFTSFISIFSPSSSRSLSHSPSSSSSCPFPLSLYPTSSLSLSLALSFFFSVCSCYYVI